MNKIDLVPQEATVLLILQQRRGKSSAQQGSQGRSYYSIRSVALEFVKTSCIAERQTLFSVGYSSHLRSPAFRLENTQPKTSQNCKLGRNSVNSEVAWLAHLRKDFPTVAFKAAQTSKSGGAKKPVHASTNAEEASAGVRD